MTDEAVKEAEALAGKIYARLKVAWEAGDGYQDAENDVAAILAPIVEGRREAEAQDIANQRVAKERIAELERDVDAAIEQGDRMTRAANDRAIAAERDATQARELLTDFFRISEQTTKLRDIRTKVQDWLDAQPAREGEGKLEGCKASEPARCRCGHTVRQHRPYHPGAFRDLPEPCEECRCPAFVSMDAPIPAPQPATPATRTHSPDCGVNDPFVEGPCTEATPATETPTEECPSCGSGTKAKRGFPVYSEGYCNDSWHDPPAPSEERPRHAFVSHEDYDNGVKCQQLPGTCHYVMPGPKMDFCGKPASAPIHAKEAQGECRYGKLHGAYVEPFCDSVNDCGDPLDGYVDCPDCQAPGAPGAAKEGE